MRNRTTEKKQKEYYSRKKQRHTIKVQIVVDASTWDDIFISTGKGREHDFSIFHESKVHFTRWTQVIADKGYQGIQKLHFNSVVPIRVKKGRSLSVLEKLYNSLVSKCRIYIEHISRYIKRFRYLFFTI